MITGREIGPTIFYSHCMNHPKIYVRYYHYKDEIISVILRKDDVHFTISHGTQTIGVSMDGYYVFEMGLKFIHTDNIDYWIKKFRKLAPIL